jgi:ppGpp synthetase/RelA/SpoT-type nucleotidyltranferase
MKSVTADKLPNMHSTEFHGIPIIIEWPKGSVRVGKHDNGESWKMDMKCDYGYIPSTVDADDDDHVDVYIGPNEDSEYVYVLEQMKDGKFDEYKVMLGFDSLEEAEKLYLEHMPEEALGEITEVPFDEFLDAAMRELPEAEEHEGEIHEERAEKHEDKRHVAEEEKLSLIDAFVKLYKHEFEYFDKVAEKVHEHLADALQEAGIRAIVTYRAKKPRKLKGKLLERNKTKNYQSFQDIYDDIVDLAGVRVALYLPNDRTAVGQLIEQRFTLMRKPKNFPEDRGPRDGIGYVATHYLVRLKPQSLHKDEYQYADTNVEIQVASVLMHAWSEICHDLTYKPEKGPLTPEEIVMTNDLNRVVQEGEAILEKLQQSVENRRHEDLRFELAAALTKLAKRLGLQSNGLATRRITASDVKAVAKQAAGDIQAGLNQYMKDLGWNYAEHDNWSDPVKPQEQIQVLHDGWLHHAWDKIKGSGNTLPELQAYLGKHALDDAKHPHKLPNQPPMPPHVSYLKAKLTLWKAYRKSGITE